MSDGLPDYAGTGALVAPTTLERYAKCPHAYLMQDVLRVRSLEEPEESVTITPMDVGNLMHEAFDVFFRSLGDSAPGFGEPWTPDHHAGLREVALRSGWKRVIVVSSTYHLRRVALACRRQLRGTGIEVIFRATRYDPAVPHRWWTRRSDIRWVVSEVPKVMAYWLRLGA